jgi:hypothetical protein
MPLSKPHKQIVVKAFVATVLLSLLAGIAGSQLAPTMPLYLVLLYSAVGAAVLFAFLILATVTTLTFMQFILRKGGTDSQWFWFSAEPPGLIHMREQAGQAQAQRTHGDE